MRLTVLLLTITFLQVQATGLSQSVSISVKDAEMKKVFAEIRQQTGHFIFYNEEDIAHAGMVTITIKDMPLKEFLDLLFSARGLEFQLSGKNIFLRQAPGRKTEDFAAPLFPDPQTVTGIILDAKGHPVQGASVRLMPGNIGISTKDDGVFILQNVPSGTYTLEITSVGYEPVKRKIIVGKDKPRDLGEFKLTVTSQEMEDVVVINTGYQKMKPNEMIGAVEYISKEKLNQNNSMNILDRLKNLTPSLTFDRIFNGQEIPNNKLGISIRGLSTINGPADPLIVLDDFIYDGKLEHINPNNIESVTILKDAVATSIWGLRAGNGVIVLTSKKAKKSGKPSFGFTYSTSISPKPNFRKYPMADSRTVIELELQRIKAGAVVFPTMDYYSRDPLMQLYMDRQNNIITAGDSARMIDEMAAVDSRDQYLRAFYRTGIQRDYGVSVSHGNEISRIMISAGYAKNTDNLHSVNDRYGFDINNQLKLNKKIALATGISYSTISSRSGAPAFNKIQLVQMTPTRKFPYAPFFNADGSAAGYGKQYNKNYIDTAGKGMLLDWLYYPAEDWKHDYSTVSSNSINVNMNFTYEINRYINLSVKYGYMSQADQAKDIADVGSYRARDLINSFAQIDYEAGSVAFPVPVGGIITTEESRARSHTGSTFLNYRYATGKHSFAGLLGFEIRSFISRTSQSRIFGHSDDPLYYSPLITDRYLPQNITGNTVDVLELEFVEPPGALEQRTISNIFNLSYSYDKMYGLYFSYRKDGANMFGLKVNDKWKPFWSIGTSVDFSRFLEDNRWIDQLSANLTLGVAGNVDMSKTSEPLANAFLTDPFINPAARVIQINNPLLRWEKTKQLNLALSFSVLRGLVSGSLNYYIKKGTDLYGPEEFDYSNFYTSVITKNSSRMNGNGYELALNFHLYKTNDFTVDLNVSTGMNKNKIVYYNKVASISSQLSLLSGASPFAIFTPMYAGLNNEGRPQFMFDGKPSGDLDAIISDISINKERSSALRLLGSRLPVYRATIGPFIRYKDLTLSSNLTYNGGFYTRFNNFFNLSDYNNSGILHNSYYSRWQKPGDELHTHIPKLNVTGSDQAYDDLLKGSDFGYRRGDNISMNAIQLSWRFNIGKLADCTVGAMLNNIGIIWSMEKDLKYKDFPEYSVPQKIYSLNLNFGF